MFERILKRLLRWIESRKKLVFPDQDMEFVFSVKGRNFYRYKDEKQLPAERALTVMQVYRELDMRVDREFLELHWKLVIELINQGDFAEVASLSKKALARLDYITDTGLLLKLASVIYIEENENPARFSLSVAEKKVEFWLDNEKEVDAFFLRLRINELIPFLNSLEVNIPEYSLAMTEEKSREYQYLSRLLSIVGEGSDLKTTLNTLISGNDRLKAFLVKQR